MMVQPFCMVDGSPNVCVRIFVNMVAGFFPCRLTTWISPWWTGSVDLSLVVAPLI